MSDQNNDWLDGVLRAAPVADEGFTERMMVVHRTDLAMRRTRQRVFAAVLIFLMTGLVASAAAGWWIVTDELGLVKNFTALTPEFRAKVYANIESFDARPGLARREGKDASEVINRALLALDPSCLRYYTSAWGSQFVSLESTCSTSFIDGLSDYAVWRETPSYEVMKDRPLSHLARLHVRRAIHAGVNVEQAVHDAEALGRLALGTHTGWGWGTAILRGIRDDIVPSAFNDIDTIVQPSDGEHALAQASYWAIVLASPRATDADFKRVSSLKSVLACPSAIDVFGARESGSAKNFARWQSLDKSGCGTPAPLDTRFVDDDKAARHLCFAPACRFAVKTALLMPMLRTRVMDTFVTGEIASLLKEEW